MKSLFLSLVMLMSSSAFAQMEHGNGGKTIYCPKENTIQVLDYQRAKAEFGLTPLEDIAGDSALEKAIALVRRVEKFNPTRVKAYVQSLLEFSANQKMVGSVDMPITRDTNEIAYCIGGLITQTIHQITPKTPYQKRYITNADRFNELSEFQRAILMVHEVILKETRAQGIDGADSAVMLNTFLFSEELETASIENYEDVLQGAGLFYTKFAVNGSPTAPTRENFTRYASGNMVLYSKGYQWAALSSDLLPINCERKNPNIKLGVDSDEWFFSKEECVASKNIYSQASENLRFVAGVVARRAESVRTITVIPMTLR